MKNQNGKRNLILWLIGLVLLTPGFIVPASAQGHVVRQGEFWDGHHGHNHYYPSRGKYIGSVPRDSRVVVSRGVKYYHSAGVWYRPSGARFVIVGPPVGMVIPSLPPYYSTVWVGGVPYYYSNETYYVEAPGGYMVADHPSQEDEESSASQENKTFIYPRQGQSEKKQADDSYACHRWAVGQTGYDPTRLSSESSVQNRRKNTDYQRAKAACLEGRGYTVK
jgi:hypothetical protein